MSMHLDHIVLWVADVERAVTFYTELLGLEPVRVQAWRAGEVSFPSARVNAHTILDFFDVTRAARIRELTGAGPQAGGAPLNHLCLALPAAAYRALLERVRAAGVATRPGGTQTYGARGAAPEATYIVDPDGNIIEVRFYAEEA